MLCTNLVLFFFSSLHFELGHKCSSLFCSTMMLDLSLDPLGTSSPPGSAKGTQGTQGDPICSPDSGSAFLGEGFGVVRSEQWSLKSLGLLYQISKTY